MRPLLSLLLILFICSCATAPKKVVFGPQKSTLTQGYSEYRFKQIQDVNYDLYFDLHENPDQFAGVTKINFLVSHLEAGLRLDFHEGQVHSLLVNNKNIQVDKGPAFILIPSQYLVIGKNNILVRYTHKYSKDGRGFHRFKDPQDGLSYTYTNLEPYKANRVFPCFDQPDLKATYKMKVKAPKSWTVITSVRESHIENGSDYNLWTFPQSQRFSTYIWSLHAGPYKMWSWDKGKYPLRLFARQTMAKYIKPNDWFPVTDQGFVFFEKYFGVDYPYLKYDQVIVPEFNSGAMENVAAVTFSERYTSRGIKSKGLKMALADVILHELAHMWFGNLVTMKWWDDLWLNESFATYTAALALDRATEYTKKAWHDFNGTKSWAYWEDQMPTTHPIVALVPDTQQAFANFDGITYGKGAASLKLLHYNLGDKAFQEGLNHYFKTNAGGNTRLTDFIKSLEIAAGKSLHEWREKWLQTASLNTINVTLSCSAGLISRLKLDQSYEKNYPTLRPHSMQVALFNIKNNSPQLSSTHKISFSKQSTEVKDSVGKPCPDIVFPNYQDYGYFKINLNKKSVDNLIKFIPNENNSFLRHMYLRTLWQMVRDSQLDIHTFAKVYTKNLKSETDHIIISHMSRIADFLFHYTPKKTEKDQLLYNKLISELEALSWKQLNKAKGSSELQRSWFNFYQKIARSPSSLKNLSKILNEQKKLSGFTLDQQKRWDILIHLRRFDFDSSISMLYKESKKDTSNLGKKMFMVAEAIAPNWEIKSKYLKKMTDLNSSLSFDQYRSLARNLFPQGQEKFRQMYKPEFYQKLLLLEQNKESHYPIAFTRLLPDNCVNESLTLADNFLKTHPNLKAGTSKKIKINIKEGQKCISIKSFARKFLP